MKLNILSDLHLSQGELALPANDADVVVLAGDIARPPEAIAWASRLGKPVLYVPGNHEFYGGTLQGAVAQLKQLCEGTRIRVLDDEVQLIGNVRFLGSTLWTDFMLLGAGEGRQAAMDEAVRLMRDFSRIRLDETTPALFTPRHSASLFQRHAAWLADQLATPHEGPTVVITHHAPSRASIHPRFEGSLLNACFVSDAQYLLEGGRAQLWIHGHTHDSFDYVLDGTRVVCNPRGYARGGVNENAAFDPDLVIQVS
jgi:predicted phosphodiesterase